MAQCPGWHGLKKFSTSHRGYTCDSCSKKMGLYYEMWGCRSCNYDLCSSCYGKKSKPAKAGSTSKLDKLFKSHYGDKEDPDIMSEQGMMSFFKDCGVNPQSHDTLIVAYHLNCGDMGIFDKKEFSQGFAKAGCSNKKEIKNVVQDRIRSVNNNAYEYKKFYKWVFHHVKEDEKKKTIPTDLALQLWSLVFSKRRNGMKLLPKWLQWCDLVKDKDMKVISRDCWEQIYDFLKETSSIDDYDEMLGWPVQIDEFVEWMQENKT
eukprot:986438_1